MTKGFSAWQKWSERNRLAGMQYPGVYAIAWSEQDISNHEFAWTPAIIYVGMTNAQGGLKSRLQQFENTIGGGGGHGGAERVRFKHPDHDTLVSRLYVSIHPRKCDVRSNRPSDLRIMGEVAQHEYKCFATFVEQFNRLPEFNDKKASPKKPRVQGARNGRRLRIRAKALGKSRRKTRNGKRDTH